MQVKNISVILQNLNGGGAEKMMINLCNYFAESGLSVDLVLVRKEGPYLNYVDDNVNVVNLDSKKVMFSLWALIKYLKNKKPDAILSTLLIVNILTIIAKKLAFVNSRLVIREANNIEQNKKNTEYRSIRLAYQLMPWFYGYADAIVAISQGLADQLGELIPKMRNSISVIYNPVLSSSITKMYHHKLESRYAWYTEIDKPILIAIGRFVVQKDFETLIRSFELVKKKVDIALVILGEGPQRKKLELLIEELKLSDVYLPGFVDNPYVFLKKAKVFVLSSKWEGFGNVLVEALFAGLDVVATDCHSGPREILKDGKYGNLTSVGDFKMMADAIMNRLDIGAAISKDEIITYSKNYSAEKIGKQYLNLINRK